MKIKPSDFYRAVGLALLATLVIALMRQGYAAQQLILYMIEQMLPALPIIIVLSVIIVWLDSRQDKPRCPTCGQPLPGGKQATE